MHIYAFRDSSAFLYDFYRLKPSEIFSAVETERCALYALNAAGRTEYPAGACIGFSIGAAFVFFRFFRLI